MTGKEIGEMLDRHNLIRAYVYPHKGYRSEYWFEKSPTNIANFIMQHKDVQEIILTDTMENLVLNTIGEFIDRCSDQVLLLEILLHLIPMQLGEDEPQIISVATAAEVEAYFEKQNEMAMEFGM